MSQQYQPPGIKFYSQSYKKEMMLVTEGPFTDWIAFKHPDGQWLTQRKATQQDVIDLAKAQGWKAVEGAPFPTWVHDNCFCHEGDACKGHSNIELWELLPSF